MELTEPVEPTELMGPMAMGSMGPMELSMATRPSPGGANEDALACGDGFALVVDGATAEPGGSGCVHGVRWYARRLAGRLAYRLTTDPSGATPLTELLYDALRDVRGDHGGRCDLADPRSPSATVALLRHRGEELDRLVLGDATVVWEDPRGLAHAVTDDRLMAFDELPWEDLHRVRNVPDGFWVAAADPAAAGHALTATMPVTAVRSAAVLSDGAARLAERYGRSWEELLKLLGSEGPDALLAATREAERVAPYPPGTGKRHDDATVVFCRFPRSAA